MILITFLLRRRADVALDEFHRYWREEHGPLVASHAATLGLRRYVQLHSVDAALAEGLRRSRDCFPSDFDGVALVAVDSIDALATAASTPEGVAAGVALLEDERRFIDLERSVIWLTDEHVVLAG